MDTFLPLQKELAVMAATQPQMRLSQYSDFISWQKEAKATLEKLLGLPLVLPENDCFTVEKTAEYNDFTEIRFTFQSEQGYFVPCHLLIPKVKCASPVPVMITLQGHSTGMHISLGRALHEGDAEDINSGDRDFAIQCVKRGLAAVTLEQRCFGEKGGTPNPDCTRTSLTAILNGRTVIGERVWDVMRLVDVLKKHFKSCIDTDNIFCMGNSGGGTTTIYAAAIEKRIKGAMPSCAFCSYLDSIGKMRHCACNYVPSITKYFDMGTLAALIAPRPLVVVSGVKDTIFPVEAAKQQFEVLREYYAAAGSEDKCRHVIGTEGHRFYAEQGFSAFYELTGCSLCAK